jgi:hypothetical protein
MLATGLSTLVVFQASNMNAETGEFEHRNGWTQCKQLLATKGSVATCTMVYHSEGQTSLAGHHTHQLHSLEVLEFRKTVLALGN